MSPTSVTIWAALGVLLLLVGLLLVASPLPGVAPVVPLMLIGGGAGAIVGAFIAAVLR